MTQTGGVVVREKAGEAELGDEVKDDFKDEVKDDFTDEALSELAMRILPSLRSWERLLKIR